MADEQQAAEAATENQDGADRGQEVADQFAAADQGADPNEATPSIEEVASELGWVPQDKFRGPTEKWKPAAQFIRDGRSIQEKSARELKEVRQTLDVVARTSGAILAERLQDERARLASQYAAAVEKGDPDAAWRASNAIRAIDTQAATVTSPVRRPEPETEQWVSKNTRVMKDPIASKRALAICDEYARAGYSTQDQLANTEQLMRREFPHLFDDKPPPQVNGAATRNTAAQATGAKTARDMPKAAQDVAKDMVDRGLIPNVDAYAKNYFAELEKRKAQ